MRAIRPVVLVIAIVAAVLLLPTLLFKLAARDSDKSKRDALTKIEQQVDAYANQVVGASTSPAGPLAVDLNEIASQPSLDYAAERSDGALVALWVDGRGRAGGLFGPYDVDDCYTIRLHGLGTTGAGSQVTHLSDCRSVFDRMAAQTQTPHP